MRIKSTTSYWLLFFIFLLCFNAFASALSFRKYTVENGLSYNTVTSIIQDQKGFIWVGTENGLNRFDGYSFREFRKHNKDQRSIISNLVTSLLEDKTGKIYVGTDAGLCVFDPETETISRVELRSSDGTTINSSINNMVMDKQKNIWISTYGQGVFCIKDNASHLEQYNLLMEQNRASRFDYVNQIFVDKKNNVWVASKAPESPLLKFDRGHGCFRNFAVKNFQFTAYKFFEDSHNNLWLGTWNKGICRLNTQNSEMTPFLSSEKAGGIMHIHEINEYKPGVLLIGSDDGLSIFDTNTLQHQLIKPNETDPTSISDKFIYPIFKDREGGFWIGTYFGGLNYLAPNSTLFGRFTHSQFRNSVSGNVVGRFSEDKNRNIWIATDDGGLNKLNTTSGLFSAFLPKAGTNSISYHNVHALCWDNDQLWIGTYSGGLNVLDTRSGRFKYYNSSEKDPKTLDGGSIYSIFKDRENRIWVTSMTGINLYNRSDDNFTRVRHTDVTTIDIKQDKQGNIWFATQGKGLLRFNPTSGKWKTYNCNDKTPGLPNNIVNSIAFDEKGMMWVGTSGGLCKYNAQTDSFEYIPLSIPSEVICCIIPTNGQLWLTTARGLVCYVPQKSSPRIFTRSDGLLSDQFVVNSGFISTNGTIYIGCAGGFNTFIPSQLSTNKQIPPVAISGFEIFNKEVDITDDSPLEKSIGRTEEVHLNYKQNVFSISFVALSYVTPEKNKFAYKLEGFDKEWNIVSQHKATYTNLPAGEYTFKVRASNNDGMWNNEGASIRIIIHPPFWFNTFFKFIYCLLIICGLAYIIRVYKKRTQRKHDEDIRNISLEKEKEVYNAKIQFFTMVAHEIRTPVSLIIGPLEKTIASTFKFPENVMNDLKVIDRNAQRLLHLVNQLLDFRKIEQGSFLMHQASTNIYITLRNVCERFEPMYKQHNIRFNFHCADKTFVAVIDQEAITKSVSNLLTNALKYTKDEIELTCRKLDNYFEISVRDNGDGIPDHERQRIFDPFYQIPGTSKQGTGIGLSLVKSIIEAHNGRIEVGSPLTGNGTIFSIMLPLYANESQTTVQDNDRFHLEKFMEDDITNNESNSSTENDQSLPVLLIVEDNDEMRNFLYENFNQEYQVLTAMHGLDALECLKSKDIDLIISDLMMPKMDGIELCQKIRANYLFSHIPFVMLTARTDLDSKIQGLNCGADAYVEKPFSILHIKAIIDNLLESRRMLRKKFSDMPFVPISTIAVNNADEQFLAKLNEIIDQNIDNENFNIEQLAESLCISRSGLFSKIKTLAGITPNDMIQLIRLKKAAAYILEGKHRINEIAYMVGFSNPSYFSKCFQKQFGMTPKEFEKQNKAL